MFFTNKQQYAIRVLRQFFECSSQIFSYIITPSGAGISSMYNHTAGGTESQHLNGGYNGMIGVARSYKVFPGDQLKIEAYARYDAPMSNSSGLTNFAAALLGAFHVAPPAAGETNTVAAALNSIGNLAAGGWGDGSTDNIDPKAFINMIIFDKDYNFLDVAYAQVNSAGTFTYLSASYTVKEAGYAYLYISNEQPVQTDVYFDDVTMTYTPTNLLQYNEYYAHGMQNSNSWTRDNTVNNFLYNEGSEFNNLTSLYDLAYRNYDATLGRFHQIDPVAAATLSTYQYGNNNPITFNDPSGLMTMHELRMLVQEILENADRMKSGGGGSSADAGKKNGSGSDWDMEFTIKMIPYGTYLADPVTMEEITCTRKIDGYSVSVEPDQTQGESSDGGLPLGMWVDPSSLNLKKIGDAWYGSAHIDEEILALKFPTGVARVHLNTTVNFNFSASDKKNVAQYLVATAMDRARASVWEELYANPGMLNSTAATDFKEFFGLYLFNSTYGSEVKSYTFPGVPTFEVQFQLLPSLPPRTGQ